MVVTEDTASRTTAQDSQSTLNDHVEASGNSDQIGDHHTRAAEHADETKKRVSILQDVPHAQANNAIAGSETDASTKAAQPHIISVPADNETSASRNDGWAPIKAEFLRPRQTVGGKAAAAAAAAAAEAASVPSEHRDSTTQAADGGEPNKGTPSREKNKGRGRNKKRPKDDRPPQGEVLCPHIAAGLTCTYGDRCRFNHDVQAYLESKGPDLGERCPVWDARGLCPSGLKCRFGTSHIDMKNLKPITRPGVDQAHFESFNDLSRELQAKLRRNQVRFSCDRRGWKEFLSALDEDYPQNPGPAAENTGGANDTKSRQAETASEREDAVASLPNTPGEETVRSGRTEDMRVDDVGDLHATENQKNGDTGEIKNASKTTSSPPSKRAKIEQCSGAHQNAPEGSCPLPVRTNGDITQGGSVVDALTEIAEKRGVDHASLHTNGVGSKCPRPDGDWVRGCFETKGPRESRTIDFEGKVYVAPLTTVGNLPFRRVMKEQGADITCGEMAIAHHLLKGQGSEWALLRRHASEDVFGVQIAGAHPDQMTRVAELLEDNTKVDFVDINLGCPIDLVCDKGMGAALMNRTRKLRGIIAGMTSQLTCPLTVKMRIGWDEKKPNADSVVRLVQKEADRCRRRGFPGSVAHVMVHGRSRLQRYTKLADWSYVRKAAASQDSALAPLPVIGNGDILSWRDHEERLAQARELQGSGDALESPTTWSSCCMLARGALIKPWLPTEIKEKRDWDISSSERFDIYRNFVAHGLDHWGSDQMGVNKTRRFLLEWLSFTCRYIPVGILEVLPQKINERPRPYNGRNELESLMCSQNPLDWIKISEMLLGPVPSGFDFVSKHKASSYAPLAATSESGERTTW